MGLLLKEGDDLVTADGDKAEAHIRDYLIQPDPLHQTGCVQGCRELMPQQGHYRVRNLMEIERVLNDCRKADLVPSSEKGRAVEAITSTLARLGTICHSIHISILGCCHLDETPPDRQKAGGMAGLHRER